MIGRDLHHLRERMLRIASQFAIAARLGQMVRARCRKSCRRHPLSRCGLGQTSWTVASRTERSGQVGEKVSGGDVRRRVVDLVTRAEAIVEGIEVAAPDGRWAMTALSRYRLCELLEIMPYVGYDGGLDADPAVLLDEAAGLADRIDVSIEDLSWRLALGDALRTAAADIRAVRDARDV
jgi:hypothetical protein